MLPTWRSKVREAETAFKNQRLDKAAQLILDERLDQFQPGQQLATDVAKALAARAETHANRGELETGWRDLELAQSLIGETEQLMAARATLMQFEMSELERLLAANDTHVVLNRIETLKRHGAGTQRLHLLREVAAKFDDAKASFRAGRFAEAEEHLAGASALLPGSEFIEHRRNEYDKLSARCRQLMEQLQQSLTSCDWSNSQLLADQLIEIAPDCRLALDARKRAWEEVERAGGSTESPAAMINGSGERPAVESETAVATAEKSGSHERFLMWVDGVGGFLVCLGDVVSIGQAVPDNDADVPIQGDLDAMHARIKRDGEVYVLEPQGEVRIGGQAFHDTTFLSDGDEIELRGVRLRFRKPHVLSATARLEFISRHRTYPWSDAILLMAESCVLGQNIHNHVVCRDWPDDVVIFRQDNQLYCRSAERIEIDGKECHERGMINSTSRIVGDDFAISFEEIG